MKSLLSFELYKIYRQKSIYIALIILLGLITVNLIVHATSDNSSYYKDWEGELTQEKVDRAQAENAIIMDKMESEKETLTDQEKAMSGLYKKIRNLHNLEAQRLSGVEYFHSLEEKEIGGYVQRQNELLLKMFESYKIDQIYYSRAPSEMIDFVNVFSILISGSLILVGLASIFSNEYATGMDQFQFSSRFGRKQVVTAKIISSMIYVVSIVFVWVLYNLILRFVTYGGGVDGFKSPLQEVFKYRSSTYGYDLGNYILVQIGMHLLGALGFALIVMLISAFCRHTIMSFLISGFIFGLPIAVRSIFDLPMPWLNKILEFSYTDVMRVEELFMEFKTINLFGQPILYPIVAIVVTIVLSMASVWLLYYTMRRKEVA